MNFRLEDISRQLARLGTSGSFATQLTAVADDLHLEVHGLGRIWLPVTVATARRLCKIAQPARHGFKDETRLDRRVRDTWEIAGAQIRVDELRWMRTLAPQLERIRRDLGLPDTCRLKAHLHNLLVYALGQFFAPHQDSEKTAGMIGTLVVSLPSRFSGGEIAITHHDKKILVGGSHQDLTFIAFYADCHHEVKPVKQGYRIVLTYNLVVEDAIVPAGAPSAQIDAVAKSIREFFETPLPQRSARDRTREPPDRLVYLLDHEYTQRGLAWNRLKNADAQRVSALQEACRQLDCEIFLALADVHETWSCEEEYADHRDYGEYDNDDDDDESGDRLPEIELTELIDSDVELRHWIGTDGRPEAVTAGVDSNELCYTKPSADFEPFESEHEGYTGNAGNTVEHWYHRAAVVLWPRERTFIIRAKASPLLGMGEIARILRAGKAAGALALARQLLPFWPQVAAHADRGRLVEATLKATTNVVDPIVAALLLRPFTLTDLKARTTTRLTKLIDTYGLEWCRTLLRHWGTQQTQELPEARLAWIESVLPELCQLWCGDNRTVERDLAQWLLAEQWSWLVAHATHLQKWVSEKQRSEQLARLSVPMLRLIKSSRITAQPDLHAQIMDRLTGGAAVVPLNVSLDLLKAAHEQCEPTALRDLDLKRLHSHCTQDLKIRLAAPTRTEDDWSIAESVRCSCKLCTIFGRYLRARDQVLLEWPLAKDDRQHIHRTIDSHDLPVTHVTRRIGRPFTLVLKKTAAIFERDAVEHRLWHKSLRWLTKTTAAF